VKVVSPRASYKKIGPDLVQAVANTYLKYQETPSAANKKLYLTWRLRVHLRCNEYLKAELHAVNEHFHLGLDDDEVGQVMWDFQGNP
jgi:hypothetical protein